MSRETSESITPELLRTRTLLARCGLVTCCNSSCVSTNIYICSFLRLTRVFPCRTRNCTKHATTMTSEEETKKASIPSVTIANRYSQWARFCKARSKIYIHCDIIGLNFVWGQILSATRIEEFQFKGIKFILRGGGRMRHTQTHTYHAVPSHRCDQNFNFVMIRLDTNRKTTINLLVDLLVPGSNAELGEGVKNYYRLTIRTTRANSSHTTRAALLPVQNLPYSGNLRNKRIMSLIETCRIFPWAEDVF